MMLFDGDSDISTDVRGIALAIRANVLADLQEEAAETFKYSR